MVFVIVGVASSNREATLRARPANVRERQPQDIGSPPPRQGHLTPLRV